MTKKTDENLISRAEFSRLLGVSRAAVTQFAAQGKIVCSNDGKVFIKQSLQMLENTKDFAQQHVTDRWNEYRKLKQQATQPPPEPTPIDSWERYSERLENGVIKFIRAICNKDMLVMDSITRGDADEIENWIYSEFD